jgi:predicted metal-binding protein
MTKDWGGYTGMNGTGVTVFICTSCKATVNPGSSPGRALIDAMTARLEASPGTTVSVRGVECLAVCRRPCTIALAGGNRWSYVVGDLNPAEHADDLLAMALRYAASEDGIVPWRERPPVFRKGVISRLPPFLVHGQE